MPLDKDSLKRNVASNMHWFIRATKWPIAILMVCSAAAAVAIAVDGLSDHITGADLVVVPGNTVNPDGSLSPRLRGRLDAALSIFRAGQCRAVLVSGATGPEGIDEAAAMKQYLVQQGMPPENVIQDSQGFNTEATARNSASAMRQSGFHTVLPVSQFFHISRLRKLLKDQGLTVVGHAHAQYFELRDAYSLAREVVAMFVLMLRPNAT